MKISTFFGLKTLAIVPALFLFSQLAHAQGAGPMIEEIHEQISLGVKKCGLSIVAGDDPRLPYNIRARNVDEVIVKERGFDFLPGVLIDRKVNSGKFKMVYSDRNGSLIFNLARNYTFDDLAVETARRGRVAFSNTYRRGPDDFITQYVLRLHGDRYVSRETFEEFIRHELIDGFIDYVCESN